MIRTCLSLLLVAGAARAQEDSDTLFARARSLPREQRSQAEALCLQALERSPGYLDVRIHLARLYAWDGRYADARAQLRQVLEQQPGNLEARETAIDVEAWVRAFVHDVESLPKVTPGWSFPPPPENSRERIAR